MEHQEGQLDLWEGPLTQLARGLEAFAGQTKGRQRAQELTKAYQELARNLQIEQRLAERAGQLEADGMLLLAMEYERIYDMASKVQEQLDQIMGDTRMTLKEYRLLLEMGLSADEAGAAAAVFGRAADCRFKPFKAGRLSGRFYFRSAGGLLS